MKVRIKNFQSIEDASLEIKGFTTIVGKSNIGKSAIVRAIDGALTNKRGDFFVRHGQKNCEVQLTTDSMDLVWRKGGGHNGYEIGGDTLESVGSGAPPQIAQAGFRELEVSKTKVSVQVADQFNPIFLLDTSKTSGAIAAEVISDMGRLSEIQGALRAASKDKRSFESTVKVREKDLENVKEKLVRFENVTSDLDLVKDLKTFHDTLQDLKSEVASLDEILSEVKEVSSIIRNLSPIADLNIPDIEEDQVTEWLSLRDMCFDLREVSVLLKGFSGLEEISIPTLDIEPSLQAIKEMASMYREFEEALTEIKKYACWDTIEIPEAPDETALHSILEMEGIVSELNEVIGSIPSLKEKIEALDLEISEEESHISSILEDMDECPTCGRSK